MSDLPVVRLDLPEEVWLFFAAAGLMRGAVAPLQPGAVVGELPRCSRGLADFPHDPMVKLPPVFRAEGCDPLAQLHVARLIAGEQADHRQVRDDGQFLRLHHARGHILRRLGGFWPKRLGELIRRHLPKLTESVCRSKGGRP